MRLRLGPKSRRTQEQRRRETQAAILSAATRLLIQEGHVRFSASRVAAMAGVSRGAQEHYFPTRNSLLAAATRHAMSEAIDHARSLARRATRSTDPIAKFLSDSEHFFFSPVYHAMIEIVLASRSDRELSRVCYPIVEDARVTLNGIWIDTLRTAGYSRKNAQQFIELTHYLLRGIFLVSAWLPYEVDRPALIAAWRRLAPAVLRLKGSRRKSQSPSRP
jgi:AcrR family transcriptional regulator